MKENLRFPSPELSQHPLMGARLGNLFQLFSQQQGVLPSKWPFVLAFMGSALARSPFSMIDRWIASRKKAVENLEPPVFIVGYWRSGTTHLHNLLGQSPDLGIITPLGSGLPDELLTLGTWFEPLLQKGLPEDRGVDRVAVNPQSPQEDEIPVANLQKLSVFHALYFPANFRKNFNRGVFFDDVSDNEIEEWKSAMLYFIGKVAIHQDKQPLLIKNPVYTTRIHLLRDLWPNARFIHIYRNPYRVFRSTKYYYPEIIDELGLQAYDPAEIEPVILNSYPRMLNKLYEDTNDLPENQFVEVQYEKLDENPVEVLKKIYHQLNLPGGWEAAKSSTEAYLKSIADYRKNTYSYAPEDFEKVNENWGKYVNKWGYDLPDTE
ncbi:MAG TPA: sulfotransferase [Balneolaceae bacterium]|nr:sulfotransferase [Balneolaceae bacterium]